MQLWGGVECTINRVGDSWADQCLLSGHDRRPSDVDLFKACGLHAIRVPILWEKISPHNNNDYDWTSVDPHLDAIRMSDVQVIAGLLHHGSGPYYTNLLDGGFAPGLARHARAVAERFPWIGAWTPINEPLTTARFSALYGHWHPHKRDERTFWLALLNQIDAIRLAMRAIRQVNPAAQLVQTDDLGRTYATARLGDQAAFDNQRRWAGWDLLCGHVTPSHPLHARLTSYGFGDRLYVIAHDSCPPDIVGVNHYLTSDRYLDHRPQLYPGRTVSGNSRARYVDVEAIRVLDPAPQGLRGALLEAWHRYHLPVAATEIHNGCTRDEQMRWLGRAWDDAEALVAEGVDVRAVTSWALLGSSNWNTLLTQPGAYETGAFDVRSGIPRPTALAGLMRNLASGTPRHPIVKEAGWWQRRERFNCQPVARPATIRAHAPTGIAAEDGAPLLICGASGTLGRALARACLQRNLAYVLTARADMAIDDADAVAQALDRHRPWTVINAAGWVLVDQAELEPEACHRANATGAVTLAKVCAAKGIPTVSFSSDLVFDGRADRPYHEGDIVAPLGVYGASKVAAEQTIADLSGIHLVVRTAAFFSPFDPHNFAHAVISALRERKRFAAIADQLVSPTYVPALAEAVLDLAIDREHGLWHLTNDSATSWSDFAHDVATACDLDASLIDPVPASSLGLIALRPVASALTSRRGVLLPPLPESIAHFAAHVAHATPAQKIAA